MSHNNISIFVPHAGCPHQCSFCNQRTISGSQHAPTAEEVHRICSQAMEQISDRKNTEIAFFGGSFTAIDRNYMTGLLEAASEYVGVSGFKGIRISTRPDFIDDDILSLLKSYGVTSIELGAQSMSDKVLTANERGHTAEDVYRACHLIRNHDFELGLQMMVGLFKSTQKDEFDSIDKIAEIGPETVRIYPVVILKGTKLAELYESGDYRTFSLEDVLDICSAAMMKFEQAGIRVIKCGLHASEFVEKDIIAGFYHPAFRELCESRIYRKAMLEHI
ncbi:MAG: elongator complex protein 3, partial [Porcipelethomonas sp.]